VVLVVVVVAMMVMIMVVVTGSRANAGYGALAGAASETAGPVQHGALAERHLPLRLPSFLGEPLRDAVDVPALLVRAAFEVGASVQESAAFLKQTAFLERAAFEILACRGRRC
jgi:hypothetical protein